MLENRIPLPLIALNVHVLYMSVMCVCVCVCVLVCCTFTRYCKCAVLQAAEVDVVVRASEGILTEEQQAERCVCVHVRVSA